MADVSGIFCWLGALLQALAQLAGLSPAPQTVAQVQRCLAANSPPIPSGNAVLRSAQPQWLRRDGLDTAACALQLDVPGARPAHHTACDLLLADDRGQLFGPHHAVRVIGNGRAYLHLPVACPKGLAVVGGAAPRLLEEAAQDAGERARLCGPRAGVLRRTGAPVQNP
ncbi:MAG: hypothetical protein HY902_17180 [Deltaproteobacteria bacterium]|nr:hypothetical protein [Deltaproteobacteria bacterium]